MWQLLSPIPLAILLQGKFCIARGINIPSHFFKTRLLNRLKENLIPIGTSKKEFKSIQINFTQFIEEEN